mgnify:CR=1 FL=1
MKRDIMATSKSIPFFELIKWKENTIIFKSGYSISSVYVIFVRTNTHEKNSIKDSMFMTYPEKCLIHLNDSTQIIELIAILHIR